VDATLATAEAATAAAKAEGAGETAPNAKSAVINKGIKWQLRVRFDNIIPVTMEPVTF